MTMIYRETDPVSGRWTANSSGDLSAFQIDQNFYIADSRITTLEGEVSTAVSISYITIAGDQLTFHMTDSTSQGPFTVPPATFTDRGAWAPVTAYAVNDTFNINGTLYLVIYPHISAATFSAGANDGLGHNYYNALLSMPGNALPTGGSPRMNLKKSTSADFAVTFGFDLASDVIFSPSTASGLTSTNISDAIEEVEAKIATEIDAIVVHAADVSFTPSTASTLSSTDVAAALDELGVGLSEKQPLDPHLFSNIPQNSQRAAYTTVLADSGKHIFHPSADTTARIFTIDSNANVAYVVGTTLTFVNQHDAGSITIAITSDTMRLAGAGTTGSRTLAADGIATALKIASTEWIISGTGLT